MIEHFLRFKNIKILNQASIFENANFFMAVCFLFQILVFIPDKITEHNLRAIGSTNPERTARQDANYLRNKCKEVIRSCGIQNESVVFINWSDDVESSASYINAVEYVTHLYRVNDQFQKNIQELAQHVLVSLKNSRQKSMTDNSKNGEIDLEEGVKYTLKELAFLSVVGDIYESCEEFVFVYPRRCHIIEEYFDGKYDNVSRSCLGFYVVE